MSLEPQATFSVLPSTHTSPSSKRVSIEEKEPSTRPQIKVGDHVGVHRFMGGSHLPCCIVGELHGCYRTKDTLTISFCATELTPLAVLSLENWRQAPRVSLRSAADGTGLIKCGSCDVLSGSDGTVISKGESGVWVSNGAYTLSHHDEGIILSPAGWLTDNIVNAALTPGGRSYSVRVIC